MKNNYDVRAFPDMKQEYLNAENENRIFLRTVKVGWVPGLESGNYGECVRKETVPGCTFYALRNACETVSADNEILRDY